MSTFALNFATDKRTFAIQVRCVAVLRRAAIPLTCLSGPSHLITTTDQAALACIKQSLYTSRFDASGETHRCLLIEANESRWLLYGQKQLDAMQVRFFARVLVPMATIEQRRLLLDVKPRADRGAQFLSLRKRRAVDTFVKESKKKKQVRRISPQKVVVVSEAASQAASSVGPSGADPTTSSSGPSSTIQQRLDTATTRKATAKEKQTVSSLPPAQAQERRAKDKLKRIILTSLRAQGIDKGHTQFGDLFQHTLQAGSFALRQTSWTPELAWERKAIGVVEDLLRMFR
ncbi:hypothetical protein BCR37DRAFT_412217 [Protomyces lactucae-debilis]|uniref:Sld7 C-terminal domain-containing protein n=1 Tax=Protomyces lactucae-debilis TaxID=2754530 RepID=A0A1Y2FN89_PROLT|nr:uncharacterized protein BCR37DRAFT_412217 [Protomyces lactucae-debilis]ORY85480.1 hypothetical protein BCR37DRAFT_412217 [Protomyces lactucae-debilis]